MANEDREELAFSISPETMAELEELIPEGRSRQERILICISNELERRRQRRSR
jgi:predicted lipid-binding transport protein (Tim44 family)